MDVWSVVMLHFSVFPFLCGSYPVFLLVIFLYFNILIPLCSHCAHFTYTHTTVDVHTSVQTSCW
jgi:hypothetical protein